MAKSIFLETFPARQNFISFQLTFRNIYDLCLSERRVQLRTRLLKAPITISLKDQLVTLISPVTLLHLKLIQVSLHQTFIRLDGLESILQLHLNQRTTMDMEDPLKRMTQLKPTTNKLEQAM